MKTLLVTSVSMSGRFFAFAALAALMQVSSTQVRGDIILRIANDTVTAGQSAVLGVFLEDDGIGTDGSGVDLESFNIPMLLDGLTAAITPASDGLFGSQPFAVDSVPKPAFPFFSDIAIGQSAASGSVPTGASSKLFDLTMSTTLADVGSHTIAVNPGSFFFQLNTVLNDFFQPNEVQSGTLTVNNATAAVPEPGAFLLLLAGAIGVTASSRRQRTDTES